MKKCNYCDGSGMAIEMSCPACKGKGVLEGDEENELDRKIQTKKD